MSERIVRLVSVVALVVLAMAEPAFALFPERPQYDRKPPGVQQGLKTVVREMDAARDIGDPVHYKRAQAALDTVRRLDPDNYDALRLQGWIQTGRHEFDEALRSAKRASAERPYDSWNYGVMVDAYVELGQYDRAVDAAQKMVDLQPSVGAYSRVSYLRWLHGDPEGSEEMMREALDTVPEGSTEGAWVRTQLGNLQFDRGRLDEAETEFGRVLENVPDYIHAVAGMAKVRAARGRYDDAIELYRKAVATSPTSGYRIALGDVYAASGDQAAAREQYRLVEREARRHVANPETKMQLAIFWSDHDMRASEALEYAENDISSANDVQAWDAVAWTRYRNGRYKEALKASDRALRLGTRDAKLLYHAGMIRFRAGDMDGAEVQLQRALDINEHFHPLFAAEARRTLRAAREAPRRRNRLQLMFLLPALPLAGALGYLIARRRPRPLALPVSH